MASQPWKAGDAGRWTRGWAARALTLVPMLALIACAAPLPPGHMPLGLAATQPLGATWFCAEHARECVPQPAPPADIAMTPARWHDLRAVQHDVNLAITPAPGADVAWHYATDGSGNCVQFALEKRRRLMERGWPAAALRLATVVTPWDEGHLVLVVVTSQGDWVLDNLHRRVARWEDLPYRWIARQQGASMADWVAIAVHG
jgi:predicted transglutaminase-like cysteine proteinase